MGNASYTVNIDVSISIPIIGDASIAKIAPPIGFNKCGWEPEKDAKPPKFCWECGDPFDDGNIQ